MDASQSLSSEPTENSSAAAETRYADVVVNSPLNRVTTGFHYRIPPGLDVVPGQLVIVPFGQRRVQGVVLHVLDVSDAPGIRDVLGIIDPRPVLSPVQIELASWICQHYHTSLLEAIFLMLPPGASQRSFSALAMGSTAIDQVALSGKQIALAQVVKQAGNVRVDRLKANSKITGIDRTISQLVQRGVVVRRWELDKPRVGPKTEKFVVLAGEVEAAARTQDVLKPSPKQAIVVEYLRVSGLVAVSQLYRDTGCTPQMLQALERKRLVRIEAKNVWRDPLADYEPARTLAPALTPEQGTAWESIKASLIDSKARVFLLQGVTGSGKTEIYMRAIEEVLRAGKRAVVLVPEIALTPQAVHRFSARFPGIIAILHSRLTLGQQYDEWRRVRDGDLKVVIGSRSAIFAPLWDLGLIVVDEEHEWSYKQESSPRYNGRDVAIRLGALSGATVILGSATPDVVTYHKALKGEYALLTLPERVAPGAEPQGDGSPISVSGPVEAVSSFMPPVHVVDLRQELRAGNRGIFSRALKEAITLALSLHEQIILYLNRRGASTFVMCRDCGYVLKCRRCDTALVYHSEDDDLVCHLCAERSVTPEGCPECWGSRIRFFGIGTEKLEEETGRLFPEARIARWDRDTTRERGSHESLLQRFVNREIDVLIGTQMIAKGLDFPKVTLVGVISADTALHLPDFRAAERTFQLLTQVAGRAGRGRLGGRVIIQTYSPEHYTVLAASRHDYSLFYHQEIEFRRENGYPPFGGLIKFVYAGSNQDRCQEEAERLARIVIQQIELQGLPATDIIGPAPAFNRRVRGKYRWQLLLRGSRCAEVLQGITLPLGWSVDVDPYTTL